MKTKLFMICAALFALIFNTACESDRCDDRRPRHRHGACGPRGEMRMGGPVTTCPTYNFRVAGDYTAEELRSVTEEAKAQGGTFEEVVARIRAVLPEAQIIPLGDPQTSQSGGERVIRGRPAGGGSFGGHAQVVVRDGCAPGHRVMVSSSHGHGPRIGFHAQATVGVRKPLFWGMNHPPGITPNSALGTYKVVPPGGSVPYSYSKNGGVRFLGTPEEMASKMPVYQYVGQPIVPIGH